MISVNQTRSYNLFHCWKRDEFLKIISDRLINSNKFPQLRIILIIFLKVRKMSFHTR